MSVRSLRSRCAALALGLSLTLGLASGCNEDPSTPREQALDTRLITHAVLPGEPSAAGLAYVQAIASAHVQADEIAEPRARAEHLLAALDREPPAGDGAAELLHFELLARASELLLELGDAERALAVLAPRLATSRSLPIDRATARCLVALGDAAAQTGDHALAMSSYARSLELLTLLLEEVEP